MIDRFERKEEKKWRRVVVVGEERSRLTFPRDFVGEQWIKGSGELFLFFQACRGGHARGREEHARRKRKRTTG